jgi:hypothetical protein
MNDVNKFYAYPRPNPAVFDYLASVKIMRILAKRSVAYFPAVVPLTLAAYWLTYPAQLEETRRYIIPGYSFFHPAPEEEGSK